MTLEEKFRGAIGYPFCEYREQLKLLREKNGLVCEKIVEEFAIDFTTWFWYHGNKYWRGERADYLDMKEILDIYKKEKGL